MASLYDDFSAKTADAAIGGQGYTRRGTSTGDALVRSDVSGDYDGDKYVELDTSSYLWTTDDSAGTSTARQQVYLRAYPGGVKTYHVVGFVRADSTGDNHYGCGLRSDGGFRFFKVTADAYTELGSFTFGYVASDLVHIRFEAEASGSDQVLRAKVWKNAEAEPGTWDTATDTTSPHTTGWPAFGQRQASDVADLDGFGYGEGEDAPTGAETQLATPSGFTFAKVAGTRQVNGSWTSVAGAGTYDYEVEEWDGAAWQAFALSSTGSTSFSLSASDGVAYETLYRARVRAVPA